jgi:O-methyltransferase
LIEQRDDATTAASTEASSPQARYLDLLKLCLTGLATPRPVTAALQPDGTVVMGQLPASDLKKRSEGAETFPADAYTLIGLKRLENLEDCVDDVLDRDVPGDLIETGVWRGGAAIFMRALLMLRAVRDRLVFVADSYEGLPPPDPERYPADVGHNFHLVDFLAVPLEEVKGNFEKFGFLDDQVRFVKGWFHETLPTLSERTWSVIRLDGDLYQSTTDALESLYPNLSTGGYLIVDDYSLDPCRQAVDDYREAHAISEEIHKVDWTGIYWKKA